MKYIQLNMQRAHIPRFTKRPERPGIYQWVQAFKSEGHQSEAVGDRQASGEMLNDQDIIHINLAGVNADIIGPLRDYVPLGSHAKIIMNIDYPGWFAERNFIDISHVNSWGRLTPDQLLRALSVADFIFGTTPEQVSFLNFVIHRQNMRGKFDGKVVPLIPHPSDTEGMKALCLPDDFERKADLVAVFHHLDTQMIVPAMLATEAGFYSHLYGYTEPLIQNRWWNGVDTYGEWEHYIKHIRDYAVGLDYYSLNVWSRFVCECACLKIPVVSTERSYIATQCFPRLNVTFGEYEKALEVLKKLNPMNKEFDEALYQEQAENGFKEIERWGWKPSVERMMNGLKDWGLLDS